MHDRFQYAAVLATTVAMAAGCADLQWHKADMTPAALEKDLADCQGQARVRASQFAVPFGGEMPRMLGMDARGRAIMPALSRSDTDRFLVEHDLTRNCMNGRGYDLVPMTSKEEKK
jgi:hypothetical protein